MSAFFRLLTGLATAFIVVPSLYLVMPERLEAFNPWAPERIESPEVIILAAQEDEPFRFQPERAVQTAAVSDSGPEAAATPSNPTSSDSSLPATTPSDGESDVTTTVGAKEDSNTTATTNPPAEEKKTTTTTTAETTTQPKAVDGTITGSVCPCTVTGTAELSGKVDLKGDLIVDGGTLIARPGVDVDGNGFQIMFMNGGRADFQGTKTSTWSNNGKSQNLKRDIVFRNMRRIMWMGGGPSTLKYFTVADSGTSTLGDYPLHWHLNGDRTRGTIVEGVVVINGRNHAFVPHGSHGITFRNTIAKNITGDAYWWDPPGTNGSCSKGSGCSHIDNSNDILYDHALADGVKGGRHVTGFLLGAGNNVTVKNSAAINIVGSPNNRFCSGFKWPEFTNGSSRGMNRVWKFTNNYSYSPSGCDGINVWQNDSFNHVVDGFSGGGIDHGAYSNQYVYRNVNVSDVQVHAAGWTITNGSVGEVVAHRHRSTASPTVKFDNVKVGKFTIRNASNSGDVPGIYVFNGSGLSCDDIIYENVVPGTKVILDGSECSQ